LASGGDGVVDGPLRVAGELRGAGLVEQVAHLADVVGDQQMDAALGQFSVQPGEHRRR
jgi:hypothetical protein